MTGKRKYEQRLRADATDQTRRRILAALDERLRAAPAAPVSIDALARDSGVVRSTVYLLFGSRAGLFCALAAEVLRRGGFDDMIAADDRPDPREALRAKVRAAVRGFVAERDVLRTLYSMQHLDAEAVGEAMTRIEEGRLAAAHRLAARLAERDLLRRDLDPGRAADLIWTLTSFDTVDQLHTRHLDPDAIADTLVDALEHALLHRPR